MHRLVLFDDKAPMDADDWRLRAQEVLDIRQSVDVLAQCRQHQSELERLCAQRLEDAQAQGFAQGLIEGRAAAHEAAAAELKTFLADFAHDRARREAAVGRLALEALNSVLGQTGAGPAIERFVVRRFQDLRDEEPLEVRVPIGCAAAVARRLKAQGIDLRVTEDADLAEDECVFDLGVGRVHAGLRQQLAALEATIATVEQRLADGADHVL